MAITKADILDDSACNCKCAHCARSSVIGGSSMSTDEEVGLVNSLKKAGFKSLTLSGGEPTLRQGLDDVLEAAKGHFKRVGICTNGWWGDEAEERLKHYAEMGVTGISVSLDGFERTHDRIRNHHGLYKKVMNIVTTALKLRRREEKVPVLRVGITCQPLNADEVCGLAEYLTDDVIGREMKGSGVSVRCFFTSRYGSGAALELNEEQIMEVQAAKQILKDRGIKISPGAKPYHYTFEDYRQKPWTKCNHFDMALMSSDGTVFMCPQQLPPYCVGIGNWKERDIGEIVQNRKQSEFYRIFVDTVDERKKFVAEVDGERYEGIRWYNFCIPCTILNIYVHFRKNGYGVDSANELAEKVIKGESVTEAAHN